MLNIRKAKLFRKPNNWIKHSKNELQGLPLMDAFKNLRLSLQLFKVCLVGTPNLYLKVTVQRCKTRNQSELHTEKT